MNDVRVATLADAENVLSRLCDQNRAEAAQMGYSDSVLALKLAAFMLRGESYALWFDGQPQFILSIADEPNIGPCTWFIASKEFFNKGMRAPKWSRQFLKELAFNHGDLITISASGHPDVERWMRILGYEHIAEEGAMKIFLLRA